MVLQVDVWATGILAYELVVGRPPFEVNDEVQTATMIMFSNNVMYPPKYSALWADFVKVALEKKPHIRPTALQMLDHPWYAIAFIVTTCVSRQYTCMHPVLVGVHHGPVSRIDDDLSVCTNWTCYLLCAVGERRLVAHVVHQKQNSAAHNVLYFWLIWCPCKQSQFVYKLQQHMTLFRVMNNCITVQDCSAPAEAVGYSSWCTGQSLWRSGSSASSCGEHTREPATHPRAAAHEPAIVISSFEEVDEQRQRTAWTA